MRSAALLASGSSNPRLCEPVGSPGKFYSAADEYNGKLPLLPTFTVLAPCLVVYLERSDHYDRTCAILSSIDAFTSIPDAYASEDTAVATDDHLLPRKAITDENLLHCFLRRALAPEAHGEPRKHRKLHIRVGGKYRWLPHLALDNTYVLVHPVSPQTSHAAHDSRRAVATPSTGLLRLPLAHVGHCL